MSMIGIVVPTYNEAKNIKLLVKTVHKELGKREHRIYVVDDNSPDGTATFCKSLKDKRLRIIVRLKDKGYGPSILAGIQAALNGGCSKIVTMDADMSHNPKELPALLASDADITIASRYAKGSKVVNCKKYRRIMSIYANILAGMILRLNVKDCSNGYRCYNAYVFEGFPFSKVTSRGYTALEEIIFYLKKAGFKIRELPTIFVYRKYGETKFSPIEIFNLLKVLLRLRMGL